MWSDFPTWLMSDASLAVRATAGVLIFATLAIVDLRRNGREATRWREYTFLVGCVAVAMAYGIANDLITSRISPEYFLFFKGAVDRVSNEAAAHPELHRGELDLQAIRIGSLATWTAGLLAGAMMLIANSIGPWPRLSMKRLARFVPILFVAAIVCAIGLGILGGNGGLAWSSADFREMVAKNEMHPYRVMCVYGIHLGGYIGSLVGLLVSVALIVRTRRAASRLQLKL